jgi:hypothetical protein
MPSPELAAGLTAFVGICLVAGWMTGFRHRSYVGWLGLAFLGLAGFALALARAKDAHEMGTPSPGWQWAYRVLFVVWLTSFVIAAVSAVRETVRRLRSLRHEHVEAAEALLELVRASQEAEQESGDGATPAEERGASPDEDEEQPDGRSG